MSNTYDIVVVGAGSNSLTAAAYLAKAGLSVCVLEKNEIVGGGVVSREITAPGFKHDTHATGMILIMANPMIRDDELGLKSKFGLRFVAPQMTYCTLFDDQTWMGTYVDIDKTCASIAKYSLKDADAYRAFVNKTLQLGPMLGSAMFKPPLPFGSFMAMLDQNPMGQEMIGAMLQSATQVICALFEHDKVRMHFIKWVSEGMTHPDERGTGLSLYFLTAVAHTQEETAIVGGSQALSDALAACIHHHGGTVRTGTKVAQVMVGGGVTKGVRLADGEEILARKGVVASIHPHLLGDYVAGLDPDMVAEARRCELSQYGAINTHWALHEAPNYRCAEVNHSLLVECMPARMENLRTALNEVRDGRLARHFNAVIAHHTNHDPSRAPAGKHTLYLYCFAPLKLQGGWNARVRDDYKDWMYREYAKFCTNMTPDNVIASAAESPADMAQWSDSFQHGDIMGIAGVLHQYLGRRPTPRLAQYAVPGAKGLYLAGPFMHPGGAVTGGGRATAMKLLEDLKMDSSKVMML